MSVHWAPSLAAAQLVGFPRIRARVRSGQRGGVNSKKPWEEQGNQGHHNHLEPVLDGAELNSRTYLRIICLERRRKNKTMGVIHNFCVQKDFSKIKKKINFGGGSII